MAQVSNDVHQPDDHNSASIEDPSRKRQCVIKTPTEMVTQLQDFFAIRENELKEREEALEKKIKLLDETYPQVGKDGDVLHLNVGGSTDIAVLRRTLTHFEDSKLAARFGGRWDDSLERDHNGIIFIDQDPTIFLQLLNYLRQCDQKTCNEMMIEAPTPTRQFCNMLEYYGLMLCVYPQKWRKAWGKDDGVVMTSETINNNSYTISSNNAMSAFALDAAIPLNATSFTAVFEEYCTAQVGWAVRLADDKKVGYDDKFKSFAFDLHECEFMANGVSTGNGRDWTRKYPVSIQCKRNPMTKTCSIQVLNNDNDAVIKATFRETDHEMFPHISLRGKVTISNVEYSCGCKV